MNYDKRFYQIWAKNIAIAILGIALFIGTLYGITQLPILYASLVVGAYILAYTGWATFDIAKFKREKEIRESQRTMDTLKQEKF